MPSKINFIRHYFGTCATLISTYQTKSMHLLNYKWCIESITIVICKNLILEIITCQITDMKKSCITYTNIQ